MITVTKLNEVFCHLQADDYALIEKLAEILTLEIPGMQFSPLYLSGQWDAKIRLLPLSTQHLYSGLVNYVRKIASDLGYEIVIDPAYDQDPFSLTEAEEFVAGLKTIFAPHDYQMNAFIDAIQSRRKIFIVPTSGGKTFLAYLICMYLQLPTLIITPVTNLITQLVKDFKKYGYTEYIHQIMSGAEKESDAMITASTWQSVYQLPSKWFSKFAVVIGDEVHRFQSKSLVGLMKKTTKTKYKFGLTGSLSGSKTHELVLTGIFGPVKVMTTTKALIDRGIVSKINIKVIKFTYKKELIKDLQLNHSYFGEDAFIRLNVARNRFIVNLVNSLEGNVIVLFRKIEKHGDIIRDLLVASGKKHIHYIHGGISILERDKVVLSLEENNNEVALASDGTFGTGVSINNVQHIIRVNPIKAVINNVQGMGRGLRLDGKTNTIDYYDLGDDIPLQNGQPGFLLRHLKERLKLYKEEQLPFKVYNIQLGE